MVRYTQRDICCQCLKRLTTGDYEFESYDLEVEALAQAGENLKKRYYTVKHGTLRALQEFADKA